MREPLQRRKFAQFIQNNNMQADIPNYAKTEIVFPESYPTTEPAYTVTQIPQTVIETTDSVEQPQITISEEESSKTKESKDTESKDKEVKNTNSNSTSPQAQQAVNLARTFLGKPYVWGGKSPKTGFDCSGLVGWVYNQVGVKIPYSTAGLFNFGQKVSLENAKVGDIVCSRGRGPTGRHVRIISKIENGKIYTVEAKGKKWGIVESELKNTGNIVSIRRVT